MRRARGHRRPRPGRGGAPAAGLLEDTFPLRNPARHARADVVKVERARPWQDPHTNSAVHARGPRRDLALLGARRDVTEHALRQLRRAAGWIPRTQLLRDFRLPGPVLDGMIAELGRARLEAEEAGGATPEEAAARLERGYIAERRRPDGGRTWVDLSPEAVADLDDLYRRRARAAGVDPDRLARAPSARALARRGMIPLDRILERWRLNGSAAGREVAEALLEDLRARHVERHRPGGLPAAEAERAADGYIAVVPALSLRGRTYRLLSPEAALDLEALLAERWPHRRPGAARAAPAR